MPRENINDIISFLAVAQERSFTRAAERVHSVNVRGFAHLPTTVVRR